MELEVRVTHKITFPIIINFITVLLYEREGLDFKFTRESIESNLSSYFGLVGSSYFSPEQMHENYSNKKDYEVKMNRARSHAFQFFPELSDDENTVKFIIGD